MGLKFAGAWHLQPPKCIPPIRGENRCQCELPLALPITPQSTYPGDIRFRAGVEVTATAGHRGVELKVPDMQEDAQDMVGGDRLVFWSSLKCQLSSAPA